MAEWKPFDLKWGRSIWYCSVCEESTEVPTHLGTPMYNFCPMCGAYMNMKKADAVKTEPNSSEKPNNCEKCKWWFGYCHLEECEFEPKDEPQTDCPWR